MIDLETLLKEGEVGLEKMRESSQQEGLTLDFKTAVDERNRAIFSNGKITKVGRQILARTISAFANSAGGIIICGVDCRRNEDGIDCVSKLTPIEGIESVVTSLNHEVGNLIQPSISGLEIAHILSATKEGYGYLLISVPRSERRPHRSEAPKQKQYFKRSGSSSFEMEHYDIEEAFRRVDSPDLAITVDYSTRGSRGIGDGNREHDFIMTVAVENLGSASAKHLSFSYPVKNSFDLRPNSRHGSPPPGTREVDGWYYIPNATSLVIHPSEKVPIIMLHFSMLKSRLGEIELVGAADSKAEIEVPYKIGAENMRIKVGTITIDADPLFRIVSELTQ